MSYTDGQGAARITSNPNNPNTNQQVGVTGQGPLAASAYWARTHDIRGADWTAGSGPLLQRRGLRTKSYFFDVNEYARSYSLDGNGVPTNSSTYYRQNQNQFFTASKYGGFETDASNSGAKPYNTYGNPFKKQDGTNENNVWQDPLNPGEASSYYLQSNARGVLQAFDSIFLKSANSARNIAGSSVASKNITSGGTLVYQASFDASNWTGDVLAFPISIASGTATIGTTPTWKASDRLTAMTTPAVNRQIVVGSSGATANSALGTDTSFMSFANVDRVDDLDGNGFHWEDFTSTFGDVLVKSDANAVSGSNVLWNNSQPMALFFNSGSENIASFSLQLAGPNFNAMMGGANISFLDATHHVISDADLFANASGLISLTNPQSNIAGIFPDFAILSG